MRFAGIIRSLLKITGITLSMLIAASLLDIVLSAFMPGFSSKGFTITCFGVAGVFSALFCYNFLLESNGKGHRQKTSLFMLIIMILFSGLLYYPIAPLSGREYNWPFKTFAITQALMVLFLYKQKPEG